MDENLEIITLWKRNKGSVLIQIVMLKSHENTYVQERSTIVHAYKYKMRFRYKVSFKSLTKRHNVQWTNILER